jgi:hypothetical protein
VARSACTPRECHAVADRRRRRHQRVQSHGHRPTWDGRGHRFAKLPDPLSTAWLPPVSPAGAIAGELLPQAASDTGLPTGVPVTVGSGDSIVEAFGAGAIAPGHCIVKLGTVANVNLVTTGSQGLPGRPAHGRRTGRGSGSDTRHRPRRAHHGRRRAPVRGTIPRQNDSADRYQPPAAGERLAQGPAPGQGTRRRAGRVWPARASAA